MLDTGVSVWPLCVRYMCTCSICLRGRHDAPFSVFLYQSILFFLSPSPCVSEIIRWKLAIGAMIISPTIVWARETYRLTMGKESNNICAPMRTLVWAHVPLLFLSVCKCVPHATRSTVRAAFWFITAHVMQHRGARHGALIGLLSEMGRN